ncbi:hypothetical protein AMS68_006991 [Peltaster fructicola]|uniref:Uncharacterized protein n=1 Tax=Peltaster fructicola TaxID=286661 RepID=A0A6H0Y389_9PEZI|nr:hypothetical protein AMS68_006991 [Peltaster fructicola]
MLPIKLTVLAALAKVISSETVVTVNEGCALIDNIAYCDFSGTDYPKEDWFYGEDRRVRLRDNHAWFRADYNCEEGTELKPPQMAYAGCVANLTWPAGLEEVILAEDNCLHMYDKQKEMIKIKPEQCCRIPEETLSKNPCWLENGKKKRSERDQKFKA